MKNTKIRPYSSRLWLLVHLRGTASSCIMLYFNWMPSIMPAKRGCVNTSGCVMTISTLRLMLLMIWSGSGYFRKSVERKHYLLWEEQFSNIYSIQYVSFIMKCTYILTNAMTITDFDLYVMYEYACRMWRVIQDVFINDRKRCSTKYKEVYWDQGLDMTNFAP